MRAQPTPDGPLPVTALRQVLGRRDVFSLAFGAMIGWGWVVLSGVWIDRAGSLGSILAFFLGAVLVAFVGLAYAELTSALPRSGGALGFTWRALGPRSAWITAWALVFAYAGVCAFEAVAAPQVAHALWPGLQFGYLYQVAGADVYWSSVIVALLCTFTLLGVNLVGVRSSALLQAFSTFGLLLIGLVFFAGSNLHGSTSNLVPMWTGIGGVLAVTMMTPFFYTGFDVIPQAAEEIRIPKREVGKLILFSVTLAAGWYMLIQWGVGLSLDDGRRSQSSMPTADAAAAALGHAAFGKLIAVGGLLGILTSWNAFFVGATRLLYSMARAGLLPAAFAALHPRFQTPHFAIVFVSVFTFAAPFFGRQLLVWAANSCSFALVIAYLFVAISFIRLRRKEPELPRPFAVSRPRLVGTGAVLSSALFLVLYLPGSPSALVWPQEWGIVLGWTALGLLIYSASRRRFQSIPAEERELRLFGEYARTSPRQPH